MQADERYRVCFPLWAPKCEGRHPGLWGGNEWTRTVEVENKKRDVCRGWAPVLWSSTHGVGRGPGRPASTSGTEVDHTVCDHVWVGVSGGQPPRDSRLHPMSNMQQYGAESRVRPWRQGDGKLGPALEYQNRPDQTRETRRTSQNPGSARHETSRPTCRGVENKGG